MHGVGVLAYRDEAEGTMEEDADGSGRFTRGVLRPRVMVRPTDDIELAIRLHHDAHVPKAEIIELTSTRSSGRRQHWRFSF